jgi:hypothetical protein
MKFLFLFVLFASAFSKAEKAYIDNIEDDAAKISIFSVPGQNWKYCSPKEKKCDPMAKGWLDRNSEIEVIGESEKHPTQDPETNEIVEESYTKIKFKYSRLGHNQEVINQEGTGYIPSLYVSKEKTSSFFSLSNLAEQVTSLKEKCFPTPKNQMNEIIKTFKPLVKPIQNLSVVQQANILDQVVGFCPLKPPNEFNLKNLKSNKNIYDDIVKFKIEQQFKNKQISKLFNEKNKPITKSNLIDIDALSRTLYGEMAVCFKQGLQYPMAVAKIILNRSENQKRHKEFIKPPHDDGKPNIAKVCTTPTQFSMWFKKVGGEKNNPLHHGLCPPQQEFEPYWNGKSAAKYESDLWKNAVRIATEAVLHPTQFKRRTASVNGYFYTSGMGQFLGMKQEKKLSIEGRPLSNNKCIEIWKETK